MPKRRRLFTHNKYKNKHVVKMESKSGQEVNTARGRLMGALMEVLDPTVEDTDETSDQSPSKRDRRTSSEHGEYLTDEELNKSLKSPVKQSYVLKLFDRSVDLSQFREDSPLYPVCRAWILNKPKTNYSALGKNKSDGVKDTESRVQLPGPSGPPVPRVPDLLPEQQRASKDNINLNYCEAPVPSKEQLLRFHLLRWTTVRQAWLEQSVKVEARYKETQKVLNNINIEYMNSR